MSADSESWPSSKEPGSLTVWRQKLDFLLEQEATAVDPDQKFRLKALIAEAKAKLAELQDETGTEAALRVNVVRLPAGGRYFVARDDELRRLDDAWADDHVHAISIVAWGGVGKSALVDRWLTAMGRDDWRGARRVYGWSFYSQGTEERLTSADAFIDDALRWFGDDDPTAGSARDRGLRLAELVRRARTLLVLDLALSLLGTYLVKACGGEIRQLPEIDVDEAVAAQGGHAWQVIAAYERWLGEREVSVLRLLGLFDRPAISV